MSLNPAMLAIRFLLELMAIGSFGVYGWRAFDSPWRFLLVALLPLIAAALWGTFAVPGDPSRSGEAPVSVPGTVRLALELLIFFGGAAALFAAGLPRWALISAGILVLYQALAYDRIAWLVKA
ncbi:YrdB family protein [Nocardia tenerifensis]|uniref:YrdB family protein n=1 Tax=Nocardia tenerifensis TaxID=228006 RepID=UPI001FE970A7|nr:YrdB family protein [Nocardia tenerifensis]